MWLLCLGVWVGDGVEWSGKEEGVGKGECERKRESESERCAGRRSMSSALSDLSFPKAQLILAKETRREDRRPEESLRRDNLQTGDAIDKSRLRTRLSSCYSLTAYRILILSFDALSSSLSDM